MKSIKKRKKILLVDANNLAYRNYYGVQGLSTRKGFPTNMIYGFITSLISMARKFKPYKTIIVWDGKQKTWRHRYCDELVEKGIYEHGYKFGRVRDKEFERTFFPQKRVLRHILQCAGFVQFIGFGDIDGKIYEADDVIGSLARHYGDSVESRVVIIIVSGDKDFYQCVGYIRGDRRYGRVVLARPSAKEDGFTIVTRKSIRKETGLSPYQLIGVGAIMGDGSDNIEGVPGIGPVIATKIMKERRGLYSGVLPALERGEIIVSAGVTKKLMESKNKLLPNFELKRIVTTFQIGEWLSCLEHIAVEDMDYKEVKKLFKRCEIEAIEAVDLMECNRHLLRGK